MFNKILIANRGEIALRVIRACQEMGIQTVAVHSTADSDAMHVRMADESVCIGPPSSLGSYLSMPAILAACEISGAQAIHPGYGFLSENANFVQAVEDHGLRFIGPTAEHIRIMGDKITAKDTMGALGVPCVPGSKGGVDSLSEAQKIASKIGYPVIIKATAGGGGRGMKVAKSANELENAFSTARAEGKAAFGNEEVYIEKYLTTPRHIEIQIIADKYGNVESIGERDCSIQRRNQKLIEECPSPILNDAQRNEIYSICTNAMKKLKYENIGTIEFLYEDNKFFFIEMNTRLQVEHPITEMVYGVDLVKEQINVTFGNKLTIKQNNLKRNGHSIECRINAENPENFFPSSGNIKNYHVPGGPGIRVDSALYTGLTISNFYDGLIAKLIIHGNSRDECLLRLNRALLEFVIDGIETTIPLYQKIIKEEDFIKGKYSINWLEQK